MELKMKRILVCSTLMVCCFNTEAQDEKKGDPNKISLIASSVISGNGHGAIYIPQLGFGRNRTTISMGACLQKQSMQFNGARIAYSFLLNAKNKSIKEGEEGDSVVDIYTFYKRKTTPQTSPENNNGEPSVSFKLHAYTQFLKNNLLSNDTQKMEEHVNRVKGQDWKTATLSTFEAGVGFELGIKIAKNIYWNNFITASFYYHTKYVQNMHHERFSTCISLGTSVTIPLLKSLMENDL